MSDAVEQTHFIEKIIAADLAAGKNHGQVVTRFPPEPNGFLHIGHAKAICLNFGMAKKYGGVCHLRFDDTNPVKENKRYIDAIKQDVHWLGFSWDRLCYASDYFPQLYDYAVKLIQQNQAFVCRLDQEQIREQRGTLTQAGKESPYRERPVAESLNLFERMRNGEFAEGDYVLRAKIDMASPNLNMRDPVIYRILHARHHRTEDQWCIYPTYDFTHCLSDAIEGITHSLCTLEFEDHRPLYDWILDALQTHRPQQIEFARLQLEQTITSKRKLQLLIQNKLVDGWDDPRMPTLSGLRNRGIPAAAIRNFCERVGITKKESLIEMESFEDCVRDHLNEHAARTMGVIHPLKVTIDNYPEGQTETMHVANHPQNPESGKRTITFEKNIYIEQSDFMEKPAPGFFRLSPGQMVKLRYAHRIQCKEVIKGAYGEIQALRCDYLPPDAGEHTDGKEKKPKVKGIIHWISAADASRLPLDLYEPLFEMACPPLEEEAILQSSNPNSLVSVAAGLVHRDLLDETEPKVYQFERLGYFYLNPQQDKTTLRRVITLRGSRKK